MLYHSHAATPRMVPGLPDPDDPTDQLLLLVETAGSDVKYLCLARREWAPLISALRRLQHPDGLRHRSKVGL